MNLTKIIDFRKNKLRRVKKSFKPINIKLLSDIYDEKYKIFFLLITISGLILGSIIFKTTQNQQISDLISDQLSILCSENYKDIFLLFFKLDTIVILFNLLIGTSFLGGFFSFMAPLLKAIYIGYFSGYLYNLYELKGTLFAMLLLFPCYAITTTALIFMSNENVYMGKFIFKSLTQNNKTDSQSIKLFFIRYLLLTAIDIFFIAISAFIIVIIAPKIELL